MNFMQPGHSFLLNDADFGVIENTKRTAGDVYVPEHWMTVVANVHKRVPVPFTVVDMQPSHFIDLTAMSSQLTNHSVSWLNIQSIRFTSDSPQVMNLNLCVTQLSVDLKNEFNRKSSNLYKTY